MDTECLKILIIDDSEDDRDLYKRALRKNGDSNYRIIEIDDGDEGIKLVQEEQPACVLLDYSLPGRNGIEVLKRIRSYHPFTPVVMLTGQGNENIAVAAMQEGAQNYIAKSNITPEILEHVMRMAIEYCILQKRIHEQRTSLEVFTHALAHDLKEPVRTIRSFVELIAQYDAVFPERAKTYFQYIQNAADRMHMLIDTVFLYTRLDDPRRMAGEVCDVSTVLQEVKENLAQLIHERGTTITQGDLPKVHVNHMQLMQTLQNLITNAIRHSEEAVSIHVSAEEQANHWLFRVSDNGPGVGEGHLQKIFEPFKRMATHEEQGVGLGLAICKKIVESHGGQIWCESKPGAGAVFLFTLPKALPKMTVAPGSASPEIMASPPDSNAGRLLANVLLVDDSRADLEITRFRLIERSKLQCNFFEARGGEEALTKLNSSRREGMRIDLILLDINMPEMDGFELLERMRSEGILKNTPVVMCTGSSYDKDMLRAQELGAAGYLTKPIEFDSLKSIIEGHPAIILCSADEGYTLLRAA